MGAYTLLQDLTVTANTTDVVLNNFGTITKDDFIKLTFTIVTNGASQSGLRFNNDTNDSNYIGQSLGANGTSVTAGRSAFHWFSGAPNVFNCYLKISENNKVNTFVNQFTEITTGVQNRFFYDTTLSNFADGITSMTFKAVSGADNRVAAGSRFQIYKLAATKVADITVASNTTQVDISNLSIDKDSEYLLVSDITNINSLSAYGLYINGNVSNAAHYYQRIRGNGSTANAFRENASEMGSAGSERRTLIYTHIKLSNIGAFTNQSYGIEGYGTTTPVLNNEFNSTEAENITSITSLNIARWFASGNNIAAGSRFTLYKLYE